jgi:hypothetical protein
VAAQQSGRGRVSRPGQMAVNAGALHVFDLSLFVTLYFHTHTHTYTHTQELRLKTSNALALVARRWYLQ